MTRMKKTALAIVAVLMMTVGACGGDDGPDVRNIGSDGSPSGSPTGSATGSAAGSASGSGSASEPAGDGS